MTTSTVTTRAASRPNGIPASSCQSSKVYRGHLVGVEEHRTGDGEVDPERHTRCHDLTDEGLDKPRPTRAGRASSRKNITTITVLENSPPYAPPKPDQVHSCASSWPSRRRWAIQLPAPPPRAPEAFSGPRLAPPISDT